MATFDYRDLPSDGAMCATHAAHLMLDALVKFEFLDEDQKAMACYFLSERAGLAPNEVSALLKLLDAVCRRGEA